MAKYTILQANRLNYSNLRLYELYEVASHDTGLPLHWTDVVVPRLDAGEVLFAVDNETNDYVGFLQFQSGTGPNLESFWAEHMVFVVPEHRGRKRGVAALLLQEYERAARAANVDALLAGSSLHHNEHAKRLYEAHGFKTNYTFKKDLK